MKHFQKHFFGVAQQLPIRWKVPGWKMAKGSRPQIYSLMA